MTARLKSKLASFGAEGVRSAVLTLGLELRGASPAPPGVRYGVSDVLNE
jgi:hypothetical protein